MSNHSSESDFEMQRRMASQIGKALASNPDERLGATGKFPRGKLTQHDEGEIGIRVASVNGTVVIDFGKPTAWVGFSPDDARRLADALRRYADDAGGG